MSDNTKNVVQELEGIIKEAITSLDSGEKVNGLEYALNLIEQLKGE